MKKELTKRRINHAFRKFKEAQEEQIRHGRIMEYWFRRCLLLEDVKELVTPKSRGAKS